MFNNNKILVVIPAKGTSKGIPRKYVRLLDNKPLIYYSINIAKSSQYVDDVVVTTDDSEIASISEKFGASVIRRSEDLSGEDIPLEAVIFDAMVQKEKEAFDEYDIVIANATHLNERSRNKLLNSLGEDFLKDKLINCIYMDVPLNVALERNAKREGLSLVPEDAIKRMYKSAYRPNYGERYEYNKIYIVNEKGGITLL